MKQYLREYLNLFLLVDEWARNISLIIELMDSERMWKSIEGEILEKSWEES